MTMYSPSQLQELTKEQLIELVLVLYQTIQTLETRIAAFEKNSSNSSKPPSSDFLPKRNQSIRQPSGKPSGGQTGHSGTTHMQVEHPDTIIPCTPSLCEQCGTDLSNVSGNLTGIRQEADIPPIAVTVTEYQQEEVV